MKHEVSEPVGGTLRWVDQEIEVQAQMNEVLAKRRQLGRALVQPLGALLIGIALWSEKSQYAVITFVLTVTVVVLINQLVLIFYFRDPERDRRMQFWRIWLVGGTASIGLAWGLGVWYAHGADPAANGFGMIALPAAVGIAGMAYSVVPAAAISFTWMALAPSWFQAVYDLLTHADITASTVALIPYFLLFGGIMTSFSLGWGRHLRALMLRRNEAMAAESKLERLVKARTRDLEARTYELLMERDRAIAASAAKTQFLANVSHELRTPLNSILGFTEAMRLRVFGPIENGRYEEYVENIFSSGRYLLEILDDLIDLSRIESGRFVLQRETVDVAALIRDCVGMLRDLAMTKSIEVKLDLPERPRRIMADGRALRQIMTNLISNALKYSEPRSEVRIALRQEEPTGSTFLYVADDGIGMSEEQISLALEPFQQIDSLLARRHKGAGLGLPVVRALVDLHGGSFTIDSAKGRGTAVEVEIPGEPYPLSGETLDEKNGGGACGSAA